MVKLPTITAELKQWQVEEGYSSTQNVRGIIHNSSSKYYKDGESFTFIAVAAIIQHQDYTMVRTNIGNHFVCYNSEKKVK